jgi:hypothetical protein
MKLRALVPTAIAAAIAFAQPVQFIAQEAGKAAEILAAARKAIGKIDAVKTFSVESTLQRNSGSMQFSSDVEILLDLPDKYLRAETAGGGGGGVMMIAGGGLSGFNGDKPLQKISALPGGGAGGMVIRMGPGGGAPGADAGAKPTPEEAERMSRALVRNGRVEASRLMLGWFATAHPAAQAQYTFAGEAESPDGKAYVIDVKNGENFAARLFIDQQTNLPLMVTYQGPKPRMLTAGGMRPGRPSTGGHVITQSSGSQPTTPLTEEERKKAQADAEKQIQEMQRQPPEIADYTLYFEEWKDAGGVKFPFKIRRAMDGTTTEEWTVTKVKVNPKVDPKRFAGDS